MPNPLPKSCHARCLSRNVAGNVIPLYRLFADTTRVSTTRRCWEPCCGILRISLFSMMSVCHSSCYQCVAFYCYVDISGMTLLSFSDMPGEDIHQTQLHHDIRPHVSNVCTLWGPIHMKPHFCPEQGTFFDTNHRYPHRHHSASAASNHVIHESILYIFE